ncbi:MAG: DUF1655 domain-containing protein [Bacteroidota bacterium]
MAAGKIRFNKFDQLKGIFKHFFQLNSIVYLLFNC